MAQLRRRSGLSRRLGLGGRSAAVGALIAVCLAVGGVGVVRAAMHRTGFSITRGAVQAEQDADVVAYGEDNPAEAAGATEATGEEAPEEVTVYVHVDGAVAYPGVYAVTGETPRVTDAVDRAGGLGDDADTAVINLAAPLVDGQKVYVPHVGETPAESPSAEASQATDSALVNINVADADELMTLPGVGEATAAAIIEERERGGPFLVPEDIMRVSGIGEKKYEKMAEYLVV